MSLYQSLAVIAEQNGIRFACGTFIPDTEDEDVVTGLSTVLYGGVSLRGTPTLLHTQSSAVPSSTEGNLQILSFAPAADDDATPGVSTTEVAVNWWAVGT